MESAPAAGAAGTLTVSTTRDCSWTATSEAAWIEITSGNTGQGNGSVAFRVAANTDPAPRKGVLTVNDVQSAIAQEAAAPCRFTIAAPSTAIPAGGGTATITVTASAAACSWTASSQTEWIQVTGGSTGTGNGTVTLSTGANLGGAARSGTVTVAGQVVILSQVEGSPSCDAVLTPVAQTLDASGGGGVVAVTIASECRWTATSTVDWLSVTGGGSSTGPGEVRFSAAANSSSVSRQGAIAIAGRSFTVTQAGATPAPTPPGPTPCIYAIQPTGQSVPATGGAATITVSAGSDCAWTATATVPWIEVASGASGRGNGTARISVAGNSNDVVRTGTVTIADQIFTVTQAAASCSYAIAPSSQAVAAGGGAGSIGVTTGGGCSWTAVAAVTWITVTSGGSGTGDGTVSFTAAANTGAARTGTLTIAGQTFTVTQAAPCSFVIAPTSQAVAASGGAGSSAVTAGTGCSWTAVPNVTWITVTSGGSGTGNGTVSFTAAANTGAARTGTLTIAGQTFTVTQATSCSFAIAPASRTVSATGGSGSSTVTTGGSGCSWTAVANVNWITIVSGASGTGNGTVSFTVAANTGAARTGTLTIAGQTFTVTQMKA